MRSTKFQDVIDRLPGVLNDKSPASLALEIIRRNYNSFHKSSNRLSQISKGIDLVTSSSGKKNLQPNFSHQVPAMFFSPHPSLIENHSSMKYCSTIAIAIITDLATLTCLTKPDFDIYSTQSTSRRAWHRFSRVNRECLSDRARLLHNTEPIHGKIREMYAVLMSVLI